MRRRPLTWAGVRPRGDVHRHGLAAELLRGEEAGVAGDHDAGLVDDDRLAPAVLADGERDLLDGGVADDARVRLVGDRLGDRPPLDGEGLLGCGGSWASPPMLTAASDPGRGHFCAAALAQVHVGAVVVPDDAVPMAAEAAHVHLDAAPGGAGRSARCRARGRRGSAGRGWRSGGRGAPRRSPRSWRGS